MEQALAELTLRRVITLEIALALEPPGPAARSARTRGLRHERRVCGAQRTCGHAAARRRPSSRGGIARGRAVDLEEGDLLPAAKTHARAAGGASARTEPPQPAEPSEPQQSIWKKEISFRRKPQADAPVEEAEAPQAEPFAALDLVEAYASPAGGRAAAPRSRPRSRSPSPRPHPAGAGRRDDRAVRRSDHDARARPEPEFEDTSVPPPAASPISVPAPAPVVVHPPVPAAALPPLPSEPTRRKGRRRKRRTTTGAFRSTAASSRWGASRRPTSRRRLT